jgi:cytochrome c
MKILKASLGVVAVLAFASPSGATEIKALINEQGCFACHSLDQKMVGPSFKMVADRYRGQKDAADMLAKKIISGGNGHWDKITGGIMMPPHPGMSMEQAKKVADWVLATK